MASVRKLPSGNWQARVYDPMTGKQHAVTAPTKREAERLAYDAKQRLTNKKSITFGEAMDGYISSKDSILSPSTIRGYRMYEKSVSDTLGRTRVDDVTQLVLQNELNTFARNHSPKSVRNMRGFMTSVLNMYRQDFKPVLSVPAKVKREVHIPSTDEIKRLVEASRGLSRDAYETTMAILLAAYGSLREGEVCAIRPCDIYDDHISVRRTMVLTEDYVWIYKDSPKTQAGYRDVPLPREIIAELKMAHGSTIVQMNPSQLKNRYAMAVRHAGLQHITFHSLRHFFATNLHNHGVPDKVIALWGGGSSMATLQNIYTHVMDETEARSAEILSGLYGDMMSK